MKKVTIIGLGWLGKQIGLHLLEQGHTVFGTTQSLNKLKKLNSTFSKISLFLLKDARRDLNQITTSDIFILM